MIDEIVAYIYREGCVTLRRVKEFYDELCRSRQCPDWSYIRTALAAHRRRGVLANPARGVWCRPQSDWRLWQVLDFLVYRHVIDELKSLVGFLVEYELQRLRQELGEDFYTKCYGDDTCRITMVDAAATTAENEILRLLRSAVKGYISAAAIRL